MIIYISFLCQMYSDPTIIRDIQMARTKQTARFAYTGHAPQRTTHQIARARRSRSRSRSRSKSQENQATLDANAQQFSVKFDNQKDCEAKAVAPAIIQCSNCKAFLNSHSVIIDHGKRNLRSMNDAQKQFLNSAEGWECEFCLTSNQLPPNFGLLPQPNPCYLLEKANEKLASSEGDKESLLLYCIDISGSMDMEFEKKSRLAAVQEAIIDELKRMKFQKSKTEIAVVTFGSLVTLFNDDESVNIPAEHYFNFEAIVNFTKTIKNVSFSINKKFKDLKDYVGGLTTYGSTALGPGLLASIELASTGRKGSKIILCTDGQANVGINGPEFYTRAAEYAKQKGVVVNILSIKGDRCNLKQLGKLTLSTGGSILKIDPNLFGSQFNKISKQEVLGSESTLKIIVNRLFQIESKAGELSKDKTTLTQNYGSFTADTELTFNFKVLSKDQAAVKGVPYDRYMGKKALMQVQLTYTSPSGAKYLQVITDYRELSENKEDVFREMNFGLYAASSLQRISTHIKDGNFDQAAQQIKAYDRMVLEVFAKKEEKKQLDKFNTRIRNLEKVLTSKKTKNDGKTKARSGSKAAKMATKAKKVAKSKKEKKTKLRRRGKSISQSSSHSGDVNQMFEEAASGSDYMESDSQEGILYRQMRARSNSRSRSRSID